MASALKGRTVLITSGPTREYLDPVRFMTNSSSGRMGFALARRARALGARVMVVSGPTALSAPTGVEVFPVTTGLEMHERVMRLRARADVVIGAAAVSDWRFAAASTRKLKRRPGALRLTLLPNPDIIKDVGRRRRAKRRQVVVGFALETHDRLAHARRKLSAKGLDLIVINGPSALERRRSQAVVLRRDGTQRRQPEASKDSLARTILEEVEALL